MKNKIIISTIIVILIIILDQYIKYIFVNGFEFHTKVFSLILTYNYGIAFSMLEFLSYYLKYIQLFILSIAIVYIIFNKQIYNNI